MPDLDPSLAATVRKLTDINTQIRDLGSEADALKAQLRQALALGEHTVNGRPVVTISLTRKFDTSLAAQVLPPELLALVTVPTVDRALAEKLLPPALYERCQRVGANNTVRPA
ncbi:MAG: hypothetical protein ACRDTD_12155 [Pseudonocardiaceae bacterium]